MNIEVEFELEVVEICKKHFPELFNKVQTEPPICQGVLTNAEASVP